MAEAKIRIRATDETAGAFASAQAKMAAFQADTAALAAKFVAAAAAVASVGVAFGALKRVAEGIEALNDLADITGASVEKLSALEDSTKRTGHSFDEMTNALVRVNKVLGDAQPGSRQEALFRALGLSAKELRDLDPADALIQVARAFGTFENEGQKARITQELFGKSIKEIAPLLADLAEKGLGNATVTKEQAEAAELFNRQLAQLKKNSEDAARSIFNELVPALNKFLEQGQKQGFLKTFFKNLFELNDPTEAEADLKRLEYLRKKMDQAIREMNNARERGDEAHFEKTRDRLYALNNLALELQRKMSGQAGPGGPDPAEVAKQRDLLRRLEGDAVKRRVGDVGDPELAKRYDAFVKKLEEAARGTVELSEVEKTRFALAGAEWAGLNERQRENLLLLARIKDEMAGFSRPGENDDARDRLVALHNRVIPGSARDARNVPDEAAENLIVNVRALAEQSRQAQIEQLARQMAAVRDQMTSGAEGAEAYRRALDVLADQMSKLEDNAGKVTEKMTEQLTELEAAISDTIGASFLAAMEGNFKRIDRLWGDMLRRMVAQAIQADLQKRLFGSAGLVSQAIGYFGGGASSGGGGYGSQSPVVDPSGVNFGSVKMSGQGKGETVNQIIVQGDVGPRTAKAMQATLAMWSAREQQRNRY